MAHRVLYEPSLMVDNARTQTLGTRGIPVEGGQGKEKG